MSYIIIDPSSGGLDAQSFVTDSGTAVSVANTINILGGVALDTTGAGSTVTIHLTSPINPSVVQGDMLFGVSADTLSVLTKDTNATRYVSNTGASNNPAWAQIDLTNGVTGALPVANGGTGATTLTDFGVLIGSGTSAVTAISVATNGQLLIGATGADPAFASLTSSGGSLTITGGANTLNIDIAAPISVANGGTGAITLANHGVLLGSGTSAVTVSAVGANGAVLLGASGADPIFAALTSTDGTLAFTTGVNSLDLALSDDAAETGVNSWNGALLETAAVTVTSDGATITCSVQLSGGGNLTAVFSDGFYDWTTAPDTVTLTAGTDTSPQQNFVYLLQSDKTLTASTVSFPAAEHAPIATVICQSAASLQTDGPYKMHAWTDHVIGTDDMGHISDLNEWIRTQPATWQSGVAPTLTITPNGGSADNVIFTSAAGVVLQLHMHTFPAFAGTPDIYVINDSATAYDKVTDLNTQLTDSTGASMSGKFFSLVIWGVVSEDTGDCKLICNLPGGSYNTSAGLDSDASKFAEFSIPADYVGTGFLIAQLQLRHQAAASGTWTDQGTIDLRGLLPSITPGGTTAFPTEFDDSTFRILDDSDPTKEIAFQASGITTATTRTITMADRDIDLTPVPDTFTSDSGSAVASAGVLTVTGGTGVNTAGAASTLTINVDSPVLVATGGTGRASHTAFAVICGGTTSTAAQQSIASVGTANQVLTSNGAAALPTFQAASGLTWNEETGTSDTMLVNNGYISNNAGLVTFTLPDTVAVGQVVRVAGVGAGGWLIAQNAGDTIHFGTTDTTTGVGGSLASTDRYDAVELLCVVTDTEFVVLSSLGNITIV